MKPSTLSHIQEHLMVLLLILPKRSKKQKKLPLISITTSSHIPALPVASIFSIATQGKPCSLSGQALNLYSPLLNTPGTTQATHLSLFRIISAPCLLEWNTIEIC
jgi:hypothetical protein